LCDFAIGIESTLTNFKKIKPSMQARAEKAALGFELLAFGSCVLAASIDSTLKNFKTVENFKKMKRTTQERAPASVDFCRG